jgi:L-arabinose transport system ATP-binding protein
VHAENSVLVMNEITKSFGAIKALSGVHIEARAGEVLAIMGENGAGKSTLLKILSGEHSPTSGEIRVDGVVQRFSSPAGAMSAGIRVIYQEPEILQHLSVAENVHIGNLSTGNRLFSQRAVRERTQADIDRLGFSSAINATTIGRDLSPAQRQLVEILRAVKDSVKIIAFDEPTSSLSDNEVKTLFEFIERLRSSGVAILYVSHRINEIFAIADRVTILRDGKTVSTSLVSETDEQSLVKSMVGRDVVGSFDRERFLTGRTVLSARNVTTSDVSEISFEVKAGEIVALAGLVGAGRTELAKALLGDAKIISGEVLIDGEVVRLRSPIDAVRAGIGLAPEDRKDEALLMTRSIRENIALVVLKQLTFLRFIRSSNERSLVADYMTRLRVRAQSGEQEIRTLSGGNQQKIVVARWLARKPKILILDEPTRGVDVGAKADLYRIIGELAAEGIAVLLISSELLEVLGLADRIFVMRGGRIVGQLDGPTATEESVLTLALAQDSAQQTSERVAGPES